MCKRFTTTEASVSPASVRLSPQGTKITGSFIVLNVTIIVIVYYNVFINGAWVEPRGRPRVGEENNSHMHTFLDYPEVFPIFLDSYISQKPFWTFSLRFYSQIFPESISRLRSGLQASSLVLLLFPLGSCKRLYEGYLLSQ